MLPLHVSTTSASNNGRTRRFRFNWVDGFLWFIRVTAIIAIVAGLVILFVPRVLNYAVAFYLLLVGILGLSQVWYGRTADPQAVIAVLSGILVLIKPAILNYVVGAYLILFGLLESGMLRLW